MTEENFQTFVEQKIEEKRQAENSKSTRLDLARVRHAQVVSYLELCMGKISELKINGFSDSEIYSAVCSFAPKSLIPTRKEYMLFLYGFPEKKTKQKGPETCWHSLVLSPDQLVFSFQVEKWIQ